MFSAGGLERSTSGSGFCTCSDMSSSILVFCRFARRLGIVLSRFNLVPGLRFFHFRLGEGMRCVGCGAEAFARGLHGLAAERSGHGGVHHDLGETPRLLVEMLDRVTDDFVV